jgi:hypothetical protein
MTFLAIVIPITLHFRVGISHVTNKSHVLSILLVKIKKTFPNDQKVVIGVRNHGESKSGVRIRPTPSTSPLSARDDEFSGKIPFMCHHTHDFPVPLLLLGGWSVGTTSVCSEVLIIVWDFSAQYGVLDLDEAFFFEDGRISQQTNLVI